MIEILLYIGCEIYVVMNILGSHIYILEVSVIRDMLYTLFVGYKCYE